MRRCWLSFVSLLAVMCTPALAGPDRVGASDAGAARVWLSKIHAAANSGNYRGTMVVSTGNVVSSSRVAHYRIGDQAYERIEALDGKQRKVYRHNDVVHTLWPQAGLVVIERRGLQMSLPSAMQSVEPRALDQYELRAEGRERIAGRDAVVLLLVPRDGLRFAQRIWADRVTGLMLRADVIDASQLVLESSAFSQVEIGVRPEPESVMQPVKKLDGLRVLQRTQTATQLEVEGWVMSRPVPGFRSLTAYKRPLDALLGESTASATEVLQAVFSDGLTHISLFIEPFDALRHKRGLIAQFGATHTLSLRRGESWVTVMGEVPAATLEQFVDALERRRP